jgi:hypothetical protein
MPRTKAKTKTTKTKAKASTDPVKTLVLRTCTRDMLGGTQHGKSFTWPRQGLVECPDWNPRPECGHGLHGLPWGNGDWSLLSPADDAVWQVVEVDTELLVDIDGKKSKFPRGNVIFSGSRVDAVIRVLCGAEAMSFAHQAAEAWGEKIGNSSTAASSGDYSKAASSGYSSTAASSGDCSTAASSGDSGVAATIGTEGQAKAGPLGLVIVTYWVAAEKRYRACVGNVGEDGIMADTWYKVADGRLVAA